MANSRIGIKIANGGFFPILDEGTKAKKKLVVTTVKPNQQSVNIELYRSTEGKIDEAGYIGNLKIDRLGKKPAGDPDIELVLGLDDNGALTANAVDKESGEHQSLAITIDSKSRPESDAPDFAVSGGPAVDVDLPDSNFGFDSLPGIEEVPDDTKLYEESPLSDDFSVPEAPGIGLEGETKDEEFEMPSMSEDLLEPESLSAEEPLAVEKTGSSRLAVEDEPWNTRKRHEDEDEGADTGPAIISSPSGEDYGKPKPLFYVFVGAAVLVAFVLGYLLCLLINGSAQPAKLSQNDARPSVSATVLTAISAAPSVVATKSSKASAAAKASATVKASAKTAASASPAASPKATATATATAAAKTSKGEVKYKIRWGDTLWDLANDFYGNPWLYGKIAKANKIKNPDRILSGVTITIPAR